MDGPLSQHRFRLSASADAAVLTVHSADGSERHYRSPTSSQADHNRFHAELAADFGTRLPHAVATPLQQQADPPWRPVLPTPADPAHRIGYGDPALLRDDGRYVLVATSNDALDAFPLLTSRDLIDWRSEGHVFRHGQAPSWTKVGLGAGDFWAPEMARVGDAYWLVYTARNQDNVLSIGLARSPSPLGPWVDNGAPLLGDGAIDGHLFVDDRGVATLVWKQDRNSRWPRPLAHLLHDRPSLIDALFTDDRDRRTAALAAALVDWADGRAPMERFFLMQPLIRAVLANFHSVRDQLATIPEAEAIVAAMRTPILAQRLSPDGRHLVGSPTEVLANDRAWEGHLVEGPWVTKQAGRYWLFYAGNDFTCADYGIGVAVADALLGPYRKMDRPLLQSNAEWLAPGHASVAPGLNGEPQLFFHAFHPGTGGYNAFRALLTVGLRFTAEEVTLIGA